MEFRSYVKNLIPSYLFLKIQYKRITKKKLNLKNPITFNEKLQWLKLYDRKKDYTDFVDKKKVKVIVSKKIGEDYIIPTIGEWDSFDHINFELLPDKFVLKCTHDSGGVVICNEKNSFNIDNARIIIEKSLKNNFYYSSREWPYKNVKPKIIAEKFIDENLVDYKYFCFNGKAKVTLVCSDRFSSEGLKEDFFDIEWNHLDMARESHPNSKEKIQQPRNHNKMIKLAEVLSENIPFVRVDFYDVNGRIYFGEMTFYPASGLEAFVPEKWDTLLGELIVLPKKKSNFL